MICGRNTRTLPTPEIRPSQTKLRITPSGRIWLARAESASKPAVIRSISGWAPANTAWNIRNSTASSTRTPATGCSSTLSIRPVQVSGRLGGRTQAFRMRSASQCRVRIPAAEGSFQWGSTAAPASALASIWNERSSIPRRRVATVPTTGMASSRERRSISISSPWRAAMSTMLRASTQGRPTSLSSSTRRSTRRRLVASATQTTTSGGLSPASRPSTASRVTASSGLRALSE